jgi:hypothetical protein
LREAQPEHVVGEATVQEYVRRHKREARMSGSRKRSGLESWQKAGDERPLEVSRFSNAFGFLDDAPSVPKAVR